ncbi:hypothetical protein SeLEV6574_g01008 [Synchytrium endobioticum]|nr:hypothetical protein SeLEV6574_g01008 [Synchytrium endobioticum]
MHVAWFRLDSQWEVRQRAGEHQFGNFVTLGIALNQSEATPFYNGIAHRKAEKAGTIHIYIRKMRQEGDTIPYYSITADA